MLVRDMLAREPDALPMLPSLMAAVDPAVGIVRSVERDRAPHPDEPDFICHRADLRPTHRLSDGGYRIHAPEGGRGASHDAARISALFEALERYALSVHRRQALVVDSYEALGRGGELALDPAEAASAETVTTRDAREGLGRSRLAWTPGWSYRHGRTIRVPAQLVHVPYAFPEGEPVLRDPITTGAAAGLTRGKAILRGLLEVIERDATSMVHYLSRPAPRLDERTLGDGALQEMLGRVRRYGLEVTLRDFTLDVPVPVVVAAIVDPAGGVPGVTFASKASFDVCHAARGALLEAACFRRSMRSHAVVARREGLRLLADFDAIDSGELRGYAMIQPEMRAHLRYLEAGDATVDRSSWDGETPERLEAMVRAVLEVGGDIIVVDVTTPDVASLGVIVVKVIVPGLQPMHLCETGKTWTRRLLEHGLGLGRARRPEDLNPIPHPFL
jgi:ribosomal protein S12 methylthiotransferase accessory factor